MTINVSDMSIKELRSELRSYGLCTRGYLDKESLVDAVRDARLEGLVAECLIAPVPAFLDGELKFLSEVYRDKEPGEKCNCVRCKTGGACGGGEGAPEEYPLWGEGAFFGMLAMPSGERKMLRAPRELLIDDVTREAEGIGPSSTGHLMTTAEFWSASHHLPDGGFAPTMTFLRKVNAFDANERLANFCGRENAEEETLYQKARCEIFSVVKDIVASFPRSNDYGAAVVQLKGILMARYIIGKWDSDDEVLGFVSFVTGGSDPPASPRMVQTFEMAKMVQRMNGESKVQSNRSGNNAAFHTPQAAVNAVDELMERLVNEKRALISEESNLYPFHALEHPYSDVPSPRIRAKDIVEVTLVRDLNFDAFVVPAGADVQVYVISVTSWEKVTGLVQTNKGKHFWLHFDANRTKRMVAKGCNWD
ncbi:hypothetical protein ACHAXT_000149 [Thalassiosira profunda]